MTGEDYEARKDEHRPDWPGYKTDHLPECSVRTYTTDDGMVYEVAGDLCICNRLRACEQRVLDEVLPDVRYAAYAAGVQAAYSAVELRWQKEPDAASDWLLVALAAIDALRGSGNPNTPPSAEKGEQA